jgi:hypothetical protein
MRRARFGLPVVGLVLGLGLAALAVLTSCDRDKPPAAVVPAVRERTPPPDGVVATIVTPSLHGALAGLRGFVDAVKPGASAMIDGAAAEGAIARAAGMASLDGLDLAAPLVVVIAERPLAGSIVLGKVADARRLEASRGAGVVSAKDGWAAIGPADAVRGIEPWARAELLGPPPTLVEAVAYVQPLISRHGAEIGMARSAMAMTTAQSPQMAKLFGLYLDGFASLGADSDRVVVSLTADASHAELAFGLIARPGTQLASFAALQRPSDFALLGVLPVDAPGAMQFVGRFALGPYRAAMLRLVPTTMNLGDVAAQWTKAFEGLADLATGEVAGVGSMSSGGMAMTQILPVSDATKAERLVRETLTATGKDRVIDSMGIKMTQSGLLDVGSHGGRPIHAVETSVDLASLAPEQRPVMERMYKVPQRLNVGFGSKAIVVSMGDLAGLGRALDAVDGKGARKAVSPATQALLDDAKKRGESFVGLVDIAAMMADIMAASTGGPPSADRVTSPGLVFAFGGGDGAARLRIRVMADGLRAAFSPR